MKRPCVIVDVDGLIHNVQNSGRHLFPLWMAPLCLWPVDLKFLGMFEKKCGGFESRNKKDLTGLIELSSGRL